MTYIGIVIGGVAGFLYWKFIGCASGACPITSNKYISIAYGALLGSLLVSGFAGQATGKGLFGKLFSDTSSFRNIGSDELLPMLNEDDVVVIDVRTPSEWRQGYISGTDMFIDYSSEDFGSRIDTLDKNKRYVVYCRSGNRSAKACEIMSTRGFINLNNLAGGIIKWNGEIIKDK